MEQTRKGELRPLQRSPELFHRRNGTEHADISVGIYGAGSYEHVVRVHDRYSPDALTEHVDGANDFEYRIPILTIRKLLFCILYNTSLHFPVPVFRDLFVF